VRKWIAGFLFLSNVLPVLARPDVIEKYIRIDQFGYRPQDPKFAVLADPQIGFNADDAYHPGTVFQVRRWDDGAVVFEGAPEIWNHGAVDHTSGDRGWWFDFTQVRDIGEYYIWDVRNRRGSYRFRIDPDVYREILRQAMRTFYYQRLNAPKIEPYAETPWIDEAAFIGPGQDREARCLYARDDPATARDLSGGWMDAGDYNKYVTFAESAVHMLLSAYEITPDAFTDDCGIPESGNGIPDILDEIRYEIDWLKRMQDADGGLFIKMGNIDYNSGHPPSSDRRPRYYGPKCSSSAIAGAGMFAHAALVFRRIPGWAEYAAGLLERALSAWNWYRNNARSEHCDDGQIKAGNADRSFRMQDESEVVAAVYLLALTGDEAFHAVIREKLHHVSAFYEFDLSLYFYFSMDALLTYTTLDNAESDLTARILGRMEMQTGYAPFREDDRLDLYRAYVPFTLYTWGHLNPRASLGCANDDYIRMGIDAANHVHYRTRALDILHYFHGVNPLGVVYLTNMGAFGAGHSITRIWHDWFFKGTEWEANPPPGYVPGGPNYWYDGSLETIRRQPPQKCYLDWNQGPPENSWEITENAIYYQASYVKLLSRFAGISKK